MFITLEGPEGAGKSTLIPALARRLTRQGPHVVTTREPGAGPVGPRIRSLLLDSDALEPTTELFLFLADRAEHIASVVRPALAQGHWVLCDRHADSTVVYQGHARGMDVEELRRLNALATRGLRPDLILLLDLDPEVGLARQDPSKQDRLDAEPLAFHRRVREGFLREAAREPTRWAVLDASQPPPVVEEAAWNALVAVAARNHVAWAEATTPG